MKRYWSCWSVMICLLACLSVARVVCGADGAQPDKSDKADKTDKTDKDRIQGKWLLISGEANGRPFRKEWLDRKQTVAVSGDKWDQFEGDDTKTQPDRWTFTIDPTKSPKQIDFVEVLPDGAGAGAGPGAAGDRIVGIFEIKGDRLWVYSRKPGVKERPTDFRTGEKNTVIRVYDRAK